jgi:hypothetical protein
VPCSASATLKCALRPAVCSAITQSRQTIAPVRGPPRRVFLGIERRRHERAPSPTPVNTLLERDTESRCQWFASAHWYQCNQSLTMISQTANQKLWKTL